MATIDIGQLKTLVKAGLSGGKYSLDTATLQSTSITALAANYLPNATLQVTPDPTTPIIEPPANTSIIVKGTGIDSPLAGLPVEATFYIGSGGEAALTLVATGDKDWTLEKSFGVFANNIGSSLKFQGTPSPPTLSLLSDTQNSLPPGLNFDGTIDFKSMTVGVATLLGITNEKVDGPIILESGAADFISLDLTGPDVADVNLWMAKDLAVKFAVENYTVTNPTTKESKPIPFVQLAASIPFTSSGKNYSLPIAVQVTNWTADLRFVADIADTIDATLQALADLVGGADLTKTLPPSSSFPIENVLTFTQLYMDVNSKGQAVDDIGLQVASTQPWTIVHIESTNKTLVAKGIKLDFSVVNPFSSPAPYLDLGGTIELTANADLFVSAKYPNFDVLGYLTEGSVLSIEEFIEQFVGPCQGVPDLSIDTLYFDLQADDYTFEIDIVGYWPINSDQSLALVVKQLGFSVEYASSELTANFSGMLAVVSVDISITADYTTDQGWEFTGKTGEGQQISIGDFIKYLADSFGAPPPPSWIQSITLKDLATSFNTETKDFSFDVTADSTICDKPCELEIKFSLTHDSGSYELEVSGTLTISGQEFTLDFTKSDSDEKLAATWSGELTLADIATIFGSADFVSIVADSPVKDFKLSKIAFTYDFTNKDLVFSAVSDYGDLVFICTKSSGSWVFSFLVALNAIDLTKLPLIGTDIGKLGTFEIKDLHLLICSGIISQEDLETINKLITAEDASLPTLPDTKDGLQKGLNFSMTFEAPSLEIPVNFDTTSGGSNGSGGEAAPESVTTSTEVLALQAADVSTSDTNTTKSPGGFWISVKKSIAAVYMDKVGINYENGDLELLFDFSLNFGALSITLDSLMVGNPLSKFDPVFGLQGLSITFNSGAVEISAGFIKQEVDGVTEYNGEALIKVGTFALSALGSYAKVDGQTSMFIFALITDPPLGGPSYFFITGVAAGFGYNRDLKIPDIDGVSSFPLTAGFAPGKSSPFSSSDPGQALEVLVSDNVVPVQIGEDWLAAGVRFTSFEMLQSFALVVVEFGTDLEIALIGTTVASIPTGDPRPLVYAELDLLVRILPDDGLVSVEAKLSSNSYLLDTACHLTGGFAFYIWFGSNEHAGDFVVTLGGYHPNFVPPDYYPTVPRLGFNWVVSSELTIKGGMYFALTPTCLMAGGSLEALWQSGDLKAWFDVGANFLIAWKPYHYEAEMYLNFGVSYTFKIDILGAKITKNISVSLGADLSIWGPPFSGTAHIHLWIISFTVNFGAGASTTPPPISWADFESSFLPPTSGKGQALTAMLADATPVPNNQPVASARVLSGLVKDLDPTASDNPDEISWIVQPHGTSLQTNTLIPAKTHKITVKGWTGKVEITNQSDLDAINTDFGVGPVAVDHDDFESDHEIVISYSHGTISDKVQFMATAIIADVPKAMWADEEPGLSNETLIEKVLVGFSISTGVITPDQSPWADVAQLLTEPLSYTPALTWSAPTLVTGPTQPAEPYTQLEQTIQAPAGRPDILAALNDNGFDIDPTVDVSHISTEADDFLLAPPVFEYRYWKSAA